MPKPTSGLRASVWRLPPRPIRSPLKSSKLPRSMPPSGWRSYESNKTNGGRKVELAKRAKSPRNPIGADAQLRP